MYEIPIPVSLKRAVRRAVPESLWLRLKERQRTMAFNGDGPYSFDEAAIHRQIDAQRGIIPFFVDIGAQDGVLGSQTLGLAKRGWAGVNYEADVNLVAGMKARYSALPDVKIRRELVTPDTIGATLVRDGVPHDFGFLNLDIDSFDFHVLSGILERFAPTVICVEINEMIPPPIIFSVDYSDTAMSWTGDRFQGFSIQAAKELCLKFKYRIGELHYNNLLLVRADEDSAPISDEDIRCFYRQGYVEKPDRRSLFPWNNEFETLLSAQPQEALNRLLILFGDRLDRCRLELSDERRA